MSVRDKVTIEVVVKGRIIAVYYSCAVPSIGHEFIVGSKSKPRLVKVRRVVWANDHNGHYDAWIQVVCDETGEAVS